MSNHKYRVTTYTGKKALSGTDANVTIRLYGENGQDSGLKQLDNSENNFEKNKKDEFVLECPTLGAITQVDIGHDNRFAMAGSGLNSVYRLYGPGSGWYLEKVTVTDLTENKTYLFPCNRWLADDEDDGYCFRELMANVGPRDVSGIQYIARVMTGNISKAGTDADVALTIMGPNGVTGQLKLKKSEDHKDKFERGHTDTFILTGPNVGRRIDKIVIGHNEAGFGAGWFLEEIRITVPDHCNTEYVFDVHGWLASDEGGQVHRMLAPTYNKDKDGKRVDDLEEEISQMLEELLQINISVQKKKEGQTTIDADIHQSQSQLVEIENGIKGKKDAQTDIENEIQLEEGKNMSIDVVIQEEQRKKNKIEEEIKIKIEEKMTITTIIKEKTDNKTEIEIHIQQQRERILEIEKDIKNSQDQISATETIIKENTVISHQFECQIKAKQEEAVVVEKVIKHKQGEKEPISKVIALKKGEKEAIKTEILQGQEIKSNVEKDILQKEDNKKKLQEQIRVYLSNKQVLQEKIQKKQATQDGLEKKLSEFQQQQIKEIQEEKAALAKELRELGVVPQTQEKCSVQQPLANAGKPVAMQEKEVVQ